MERLDRALGVPPIVTQPVNDFCNVLTRSAKKRVETVLECFEQRFPQLGAVVAFCAPPEGIPLGAYTFWMFNHSQAVSALEAGSSNRLILVTLDPQRGSASCMIGYGLEPFLTALDLQKCLEAGSSAFAAKEWVDGVMKVFQALDVLASRVCTSAAETYGWKGEVVHGPDDLDGESEQAVLSY
ncbi:MAG: hypothetical protein JNJ83_03205 [Verrucomicrobiaceae bacterium]|nr:hypothetical protein [Verrucomicrobiaceae bacterium]